MHESGEWSLHRASEAKHDFLRGMVLAISSHGSNEVRCLNGGDAFVAPHSNQAPRESIRMKTTMKHTILLASLSTFFGVNAHAAADGFNFYGLIDGGIASTKIKGAGGTTRTEFVTGGYAPNFVGLTAQKSIASGLKGGVQLEQGFLLNSNPCATACTNPSSRFWFGADSIANRRANVYVEGSFGTVRFGTQGNIAFSSVLMADPRFGSNYGSALAAVNIDGALSTADNSALSYTSPSYSGLSGAVSILSTQRNNIGGTITSGYRAAGTYKADNLGATLAYYKNEPGAGREADGTILGGTYKMGAVTLKGLFVTQDNGGALAKLKTTGFGGAYAATSNLTLDAGYYTSKDSAAGYKQKTLGFGAQYKIIKDLSLYAQYADVKNDGTALASFNFAGPTIQAFQIATGQKATTINVGALFGFF